MVKTEHCLVARLNERFGEPPEGELGVIGRQLVVKPPDCGAGAGHEKRR